MTAQQFSQTLKETVRELEMKLESLSDSSERERNSLRRELSYIQDESKFSLSKVTAEVTYSQQFCLTKPCSNTYLP
jgi:mitotic spindle assembly checkpoint protein MAD1